MERPNLRLIEGDGEQSENDKTERVLRVVQGVNLNYAQNLVSIPGNPFYKGEEPPDDAA